MASQQNDQTQFLASLKAPAEMAEWQQLLALWSI